MKIRQFVPSDSESLGLILHQSVQQIASKHYTQAQRTAWSPQPMDAQFFLKRISDGRWVWVAINEADTPLGFIELESNGHIDCFYCAPSAVGVGVGNALYQQLESHARTQSIARLYVEASEGARGFFSRAGFKLLERREVKRNDIKLHHYAMTKGLNTA